VAYDRAVGSPLIIRPARVRDVRQMARVHVRCWQETYRGLMPDAVLDDPGFPAARERMWTEVLTSGRYRQNRVAVAERDGELAGIAMSGPPGDAAAAGWTRQLYVLYVDAADHGTVSAAELAGIAPEGWAALRLHPLPHAHLLRSTCNIDAFRRAADRGEPRPALRRWRRPRHLLVWRPALDVRYRQVETRELPALLGALHGDTFAQLCERLAQRHGDSDLPRMAALLAQWLGDGLIGQLALPGGSAL